jgi:moderate conductance mechanosensitive channel
MVRSSFLIMTLALLSCCWAQNIPTTSPTTDTSMTLERIEASIAFLEDSQKVAALAAQLRELARAQHLVMRQNGDTTKSKERPGFYELVKERIVAGKKYMLDVSSEFQRSTIAMITRDGGIVMEKQRSRILVFSMVAVIFIAIFTVIFMLMRRLSKMLTKKNNGEKKIFTGIAKALRQLAIPFSSGVAAFVFKFIPTFMQSFFQIISTKLFIYSAVLLLCLLLLSSEGPIIRLWKEREKTADFFIRHFRTLARMVLMSYVLYALAGIFEMVRTQQAVLWLLQVVMMGIVPYTLAKLRPKLTAPLLSHSAPGKKLRVVITETIIRRLPLMSFLLLMVMTILLISGKTRMYGFLLNGTIKTLFALLVGGFSCFIWYNILQRSLKNPQSFLAKNADLYAHVNANGRVISIVGYSVVGAVVLFYLFKIWGRIEGGLFNSDISLVRNTIRIATIIAGIWIAVQLAYYGIKRFGKTAKKRMLRAEGANQVEIEKRVDTLSGIFQKIVAVSLIVIGIIMIMDELGFDIKAMVAGVGIVGLAVGFGAQNLVRDVISGLFVIFENKIRVGDVAIINGTGGLVEQVNLRTSVLRGLNGTIHVFPNGEITSLSNMTHDFSYYLFDIGVAYKEDTDKVVEVLKQIDEEIRSESEFNEAILEPLEILGVDAFADSAVIIKARIKTVPIKQWFIGREMNRRIKKRFDELDIEIPFPHRTLYFGDASKPFSLNMDGDNPTPKG